MTRMTAKADIKKHGQVAINNALYQEFLQLHDLDGFEGQHASTLTTDVVDENWDMLFILYGDARTQFEGRSSVSHEGLVFGSGHRFDCSGDAVRNWEIGSLLTRDFASGC